MTTRQAQQPGSGEALVWLTAVGLATGLLMVAGILGIIVVQGVSAFWPRRVVLLDLAPATPGGAPERVAGELLRQQPGASGPEWQVFTGNKDVYDLAFRYVPVARITARSEPHDLMRFERLEYGPVLGVPVALEAAGTPPLPATGPGFAARLDTAVRAMAVRRGELREVERDQIGRLNLRQEELRLQLKGLLRREPAMSAGDPRRRAIDQQLALLQHDYEELAARARDLRAGLSAAHLRVRLATGQELRLALGQVLSCDYVNQLGAIGRVGVWLRRVGSFLATEPREANTEGGIFPAIFGTFVMTVIMSLAVTPFGVLAAIYLHEYARQGPLVRGVRIAVNNLAGVPSIVFGVFGLGFLVYGVGGSLDRWFFADALPTPTFGTGGVLWAALTLALLTVPVVIVASEEALAAVPRGVREGSLALGASKWQTVQRVVLPAAAPGILTGLMLAMARGAGEVAPLMLVGVVKLAPTLPLNGIWPFLHLDQKFMHLGFHLYDLGFQSPDSDAAKPMVFATTLFLILLVVVLNLAGILVRERLRRKYAGSVF